MTEAGSLEPDAPLCPVNADDLKRVWDLIQNAIADHGLGVAIDEGLVSQQCSPGTDLIAIGFRVAILQYLLGSGMLDDWREGNEPVALVFQVGATFPIEQGAQGFDPAEFIERLRSETITGQSIKR